MDSDYSLAYAYNYQNDERVTNEHQEVPGAIAEETSEGSDANPLDGGASVMDATVRFSEQCHDGVGSGGTHLTSVR